MRCRRRAAAARAVIALGILLSLSTLQEAAAAPDVTTRLLEAVQIRRPDGAGPFPAIMLVPGCSGMARTEHAAHYRELAGRLGGLGYLVAHVDYVAARRLTQACGSVVTPDEIARDIVAVATHLRSLRLVDPARLDVLGESLGGGGVLAALAPPGRAPFRRAVVFYPVCRGVRPPHASAEVLLLFGALDGMTPAESCRQIVAGLPAPRVRVYAGARHGFDLGHLPRVPPAGTPSWSPAYQPAAAAAAWDETARFLAR